MCERRGKAVIPRFAIRSAGFSTPLELDSHIAVYIGYAPLFQTSHYWKSNLLGSWYSKGLNKISIGSNFILFIFPLGTCKEGVIKFMSLTFSQTLVSNVTWTPPGFVTVNTLYLHELKVSCSKIYKLVLTHKPLFNIL